MEKKTYPMDVQEKTFVNDAGEKITYLDCSVVVAGERFTLNVLKNQKSLFKYLVMNK